MKTYILAAFYMLVSLLARGQSVEYSIKALFIEKIARHTSWETATISESFVICILGDNPFKGELEKLAKKTTLKNKPITIRYIGDLTQIKDCNIVYICESEKYRLETILAQLAGKNILLLSDTPGFCKKGVHFNFYFDEEDRLKYEVNPAALKKTGLQVDLQLLNYGKIVR